MHRPPPINSETALQSSEAQARRCLNQHIKKKLIKFQYAVKGQKEHRVSKPKLVESVSKAFQEPLVILLHDLQNPVNENLSILNAELIEIDLAVDDLPVVGELLQNAFSHSVISGELLKCRPFEIFFIVLLRRRAPAEYVGGIAKAAGDPAPAAAAGYAGVIGPNAEDSSHPKEVGQKFDGLRIEKHSPAMALRYLAVEVSNGR